MVDEVVTLADFAKQLGIDKTGVLKFIRSCEEKAGRRFLQAGRGRGNQRSFVLTRADAAAILEIRKQKGFTAGNKASVIVTPAGEPTVYVLGLPDTRLKIGFTETFKERLTSHRTIVPDLEVLRQWPLGQAYEVVMIGLARHAEGIRQIGPEVFAAANNEAREALLARFDDLAAKVGATS